MSNEITQNQSEKKFKLPFKLSSKLKLILILSLELVVILAILILILFAGKKSYTVTFDLNGGILIGGDLTQRVTQGQNAQPPNVAKFGHYLLGWSGSFRSVTRDVTVKAIWEYETSPGIEYSIPENTNYCEISGSFRDIQGDLFIGSYHEGRQVMGIMEGAFKNRTGITGVYLLDGILSIEDEAFAGCVNMEVIEIPSTVVRIGKDAFRGCKNLKEIILPKSLKIIEAGAFADCDSITTVTIPESVEEIEMGAFNGVNMTINVYFSEEETPVGFASGWYPHDATVVYEYDPDESEDVEQDENEKKPDGDSRR